MKVWLNGRLLEEAEACISPADRGLLLGDGVFETLRSYGGVPFALGEHLERLAAGARVLGIAVPALEQLDHGVRAVLAAHEGGDARVRVTVTSGSGPPGLARGSGPGTVVIAASDLKPWPSAATAVLAPWPHDELSPLAGVKTTSRADSVIALAHAREQGADEALFANGRGELCEATTANVFLVEGTRVSTPALDCGCLPGITREHVLRLCPGLGVDAREAALPASALADADELFLTSSTRGVQPLVRVDGRDVDEGRPGRVTIRLAEAYDQLVKAAVAGAG